MRMTRRSLLTNGAKSVATLATLAHLPRPLLAQWGEAVLEPGAPLREGRLKELTARALEAARAAGAVYADVRLTHAFVRQFEVAHSTSVGEVQFYMAGVRALVDGYWGFASSTVWTPDELARLAREAVYQAKVNATVGKAQTIELAPTPPVRDGHWVMPVKIDPFDVHPLEVVDYLRGLAIFTARFPRVRVIRNRYVCHKLDKAFGSTEGSYYTQRTYLSLGVFEFSVSSKDEKRRGGGGLDLLTPAGVGWELYREQPLREALRQAIAEVEADLSLPRKPVEVGRYDAVLDAMSVANLVAQTLRPATELDRAMGYEANAGGTSYLTDPLGMVGTYQAAAPTVTLVANRSEPGGCATVKWDDEGVEPDEFPIIQDGVLVDFQTTRESAGWLREYYARARRPFRSHGCAASTLIGTAPGAGSAPLQHAPNLVLRPGRDAQDFDALVAGVGQGIAVRGLALDMDFQHASGLATGRAYEIKRGKRVALVDGAGFLFRSTDLWKSLLALGGPSSLRRYGQFTVKGEPQQQHVASVTAPPAVFKQVTTIDAMRKA